MNYEFEMGICPDFIVTDDQQNKLTYQFEAEYTADGEDWTDVVITSIQATQYDVINISMAVALERMKDDLDHLKKDIWDSIQADRQDAIGVSAV